MHKKQIELEEFNRYAFDDQGREGNCTSRALQKAIIDSRKHIEAAFKHAISIEELGRMKVRVKV